MGGNYCAAFADDAAGATRGAIDPQILRQDDQGVAVSHFVSRSTISN